MSRHVQYAFHGTNYGSLAAAKKVAQQYAEDTGRKTFVEVNTLVKTKQGNYTDNKIIGLTPKAIKKNPTISTSSIPIGEWSPAHAIRQNADGSVDILREKNSGRRANISEGFMAGGVFHPIRGASDYDASRVGESRTYKKKRKKGTKPTATGRKYTPKKASTKRAMVTSRRDYGGDGSRYRNPGDIKIKFTVRDRIGKPSKAPHTRNFAEWADVKEYGQKLANTKKQNVDWKETTGPSFLRRSGVFYAK